MAKEGSTISGFADAFAQAISYALQYGVPLQDLVDKFSHVRFEPSGMTKNPDVRFAKSIVDYIFRWMAAKFLSPEAQFRAGVNNREETRHDARAAAARRCGRRGCLGDRRDQLADDVVLCGDQNQEDAPPCSTCGSIMVRCGLVLQVRELRHDVRLRLIAVRCSRFAIRVRFEFVAFASGGRQGGVTPALFLTRQHRYDPHAMTTRKSAHLEVVAGGGLLHRRVFLSRASVRPALRSYAGDRPRLPNRMRRHG